MSDKEDRINYYLYEPEPGVNPERTVPNNQPVKAPVMPRKVSNQPVQNEVEIDLVPLLQALLRKWWLIALAAIVCGVIAFAVTRFAMTPMYTSDFTAFVSNKSTQVVTVTDDSRLSNDDINASRNLAQTYAAIITSRSVLNGAAMEAKLNMDYETLLSYVSTEVQTDTQLIKVTVTTESPEESLALARAIENIAKQYIERIISGSSMEFPDAPQIAKEPSSPNVLKNTAVGILLGMLLAAAIIVVKELTDKRIRDESELESIFNIPVIGTIPDYRSAQDSHNYSYKSTKGGASA